jgi:hypothetical protein
LNKIFTKNLNTCNKKIDNTKLYSNVNQRKFIEKNASKCSSTSTSADETCNIPEKVLRNLMEVAQKEDFSCDRFIKKLDELIGKICLIF